MDTTSGDGGPGPVEPGDGATPEGSAPPGGGTEAIPSARPPISIDDVADFETFPPVPDEMPDAPLPAEHDRGDDLPLDKRRADLVVQLNGVPSYDEPGHHDMTEEEKRSSLRSEDDSPSFWRPTAPAR